MGKVTADQSMSVDGFTTGPNVRIGNPLGDGGERLHAWMFQEGGATGRNAEIRDEFFASTGALLMGRRMFDMGVEPWGDNPPFHQPVFVVTHQTRDPLVKQGGTTYVFVIGGVERALAHGRSAAGDRDVGVVGGANTIQQLIKAGLLDELRIHLVPVLLGDGTRMFERTGAEPIELESTRVIEAPGVTHLTLRLAAKAARREDGAGP